MSYNISGIHLSIERKNVFLPPLARFLPVLSEVFVSFSSDHFGRESFYSVHLRTTACIMSLVYLTDMMAKRKKGG
jgi:hypothetical protein